MSNQENLSSNPSASTSTKQHQSNTFLSEMDKTNEEVIDLRAYFAIINRHKWRIFSLAFIVALLAAIVALNITSTYKASATLLIEAKQTKAVSFERAYGFDSNQKEYYLTQFEVLKSRTIAKAVIQKLNLKEHPDFIGKPSAIREFINSVKASLPFLPQKAASTLSQEEEDSLALQSLVEKFVSRLTVSPVRKTQLVKISFTSGDPKLAALVANTVGEVYIEQDMLAKIHVTKEASGWLTTRLFDLRNKLDASEAKLQQYRERENLIDVSGILGLVSKELEQTSKQLVIERHERNKLRSIVRIIEEYGRDNLEMLSSISEITSQGTIQDVKRSLVIAELKISEKSQVYGPKHPQMVAAQAELLTVQNSLSKQVQRLVIGVEKQLSTKQRNIDALKKELVGIKAKYQVLTKKEYEYKRLTREVGTNRNIYNTFMSRSKETDVTSDFTSAVARFTDRAFMPIKPAKPNKPLIVVLAFILTLGLGVVFAFVVDALNDTFKSSGDIENKLSQRMLGLLPLIPLKRKANLSLYHFFEEKGRKFAESVRTLRTSFVLTQLDKETKVIEVTSSVPGEGKTTTSTNLAFSLAQVERTLLIDADMRKPSICKRFGIPPYHPGLANIIAGTETLTDCIYHDDTSGLSVMPSGQVPPNPLELLSSPKFKGLLAELKETYDRIVIDTPPVHAVSDSLLIASHADAVIYVVKSDDTRIKVAQEGIGRLVEANAKIAGVVLNRVDTKRLAKTDSYQGYYNEYSYGDIPEAPSVQSHDDETSSKSTSKKVS